MLTALLVLLLVLGTTGARANSTPGLVEQWYLKDVVSVADFSASFWNRGEEGPCTPVRQGGTWHRGGGPPSAGPRVLLPDPPALRAALGCLAGRCCPSRWTGER
jgi:hypothetical protein